MRLVKVVKMGGFWLTKWITNDRQVLGSINESKLDPSIPITLEELPTERTLGVCWDAENDLFTFQVMLKEKLSTRRGLVSVTSSKSQVNRAL